MSSTNIRKIQLHKQELDEKYLSRKLTEITENTPTIIQNLNQYKKKFNVRDNSKLLIHEKALIKILLINRRTLNLIIGQNLICYMDLFGLRIYSVKDIQLFLMSISKKVIFTK